MAVFQIFLICVTFIVSCRCQCDLSKFKTYKIVPDVVTNMPEKPLQVAFFNKSFECGTNTGYFMSIKAPTLQYDADDKKLYTVIMIDTSPIPDLNVNIRFLHWLVVNIPGNKVNDGKTLANYVIPTPPPFSGEHKYIILVWEQLEEIDPSGGSPMRNAFDENAYAKSHNLKGPVYGYFFLAGNSLKTLLKSLFSSTNFFETSTTESSL